MSLENVITAAKKYYPELQVKFKDESSFMKVLATLLFFNKEFITKYSTTIGNTVYFPTKDYLKTKNIVNIITFLHELVHIEDAKRVGHILYSFLYLFPQILAVLAIPLFFFNWWVALILFIVLLAPLPAYFRMVFEKRAYFTSLYVAQRLGTRLKFNPLLEENKEIFLKQFKNSSYYFMWIFPNLDKEFDQAVKKIEKGERPFEDYIFNILDELCDHA